MVVHMARWTGRAEQFKAINCLPGRVLQQVRVREGTQSRDRDEHSTAKTRC